MFKERRSIVPAAVIWTRIESTRDEVRILPDGSMDLIWGSTGELFVAGPDTRAQMHFNRPGRVLTGIRFAPGVAPAFLGMPASELLDLRVPLGALWPSADTRAVADRLAGSPAPDRTLEMLVSDRLSRDGRELPRTAEIVRLLRAGRSVADVAGIVGLSGRQLRRRSIQAFGYGPKMLARVLRFGRALELARSGFPLSDVAASAGFADQAHLARDVRTLAGVPMTHLLGRHAQPPDPVGQLLARSVMDDPPDVGILRARPPA
jgi:AraC-like DNA-binding protein